MLSIRLGTSNKDIHTEIISATTMFEFHKSYHFNSKELDSANMLIYYNDSLKDKLIHFLMKITNLQNVTCRVIYVFVHFSFMLCLDFSLEM